MEAGKIRVIIEGIDKITLADIASGNREYVIGDCGFAVVYFGIKDDGEGEEEKEKSELEEEYEDESVIDKDDDEEGDLDAIYDEGFDAGYDAGYADGYMKASHEFRKEKTQEAGNGKNA